MLFFFSLLAGSLHVAAAGTLKSACFRAASADFKASSYEVSYLEGGFPVLIDVQKPDRFYEKSQGQEAIAIGSRSWIHFNGKPWQSLAYAHLASVASFDPVAVLRQEQLANCTDAGASSWRGVPAHVLKAVWTGAHGTISLTMYVLPDGYVHHLDEIAPRGPMSYDLSHFNAISIEAP